MKKRAIDPDVTRKDDAAYWAAALVLAIEAGDAEQEATARVNLRRLGYELDTARPGEAVEP